MTPLSTRRRQLLLASLAAAGTTAWPKLAAAAEVPPRTAAKSRVIVIGGGMAGATVAKYLRLWGDAIEVTLIERNVSYTSCIMSSLVLSGQRSLDSLKFGYDRLIKRYGVQLITDEVVGLDPVNRVVTLAQGGSLSADRIVIAPGIDFDPVPGLNDPDAMPHAWKAGPQTGLLRKQLLAMSPKGVAVLTIPKTPYRCPPGPYERACLLADWLRHNKRRAKLLVLDANPDFVVEADNFGRAFFDLYGSIIDYRPNTNVLSADSTTMTLTTDQGQVQGDVINLIPRQRCGPIVTLAGLNNATEGRFAGVDVLSYESTLAPGVHIIGDSSATTQPKAGHIANQEAKVCADAIARLLAGESPDAAPVTNSACFSTITMKQASWLSAVFQYDANLHAMSPVAAAGGASDGWSGEHFSDMNLWFKSLMSDSFA